MVGLVLLTLVCGLLITTVRHQETICAETLDFALSDRNPDSAAAPRFPTDGQKPPLKPDGFDAPRSRSFFVVQLSDEGEIESVSRTNLTLLDQDAETAVQAALATGKIEGTLRDLSLSFRIAEKRRNPHRLCRPHRRLVHAAAAGRHLRVGAGSQPCGAAGDQPLSVLLGAASGGVRVGSAASVRRRRFPRAQNPADRDSTTRS